MKSMLQKFFRNEPLATVVLALQMPIYLVSVLVLVLTGWVDVTYKGESDVKWIGIGLLAVLGLSLTIRAIKGMRKRLLGTKASIAAGHFTVFQCALMAIGSGIFEEVLFRGFLQSHLGLVAASIVFGVLHYDKALKRYMVFAMGAGLVLGGLTIASGSLVPAIVAHVVNNFVGFLLARRDRANLKEDAREWGRRLAREARQRKVAIVLEEDEDAKAHLKALREVKTMREKAKDMLLPSECFYLIREWDDTLNKVEVVSVDPKTEDVAVRYEDGVTHIVSAEYFRSIEVKALGGATS